VCWGLLGEAYVQHVIVAHSETALIGSHYVRSLLMSDIVQPGCTATVFKMIRPWPCSHRVTRRVSLLPPPPPPQTRS
jgi:hypothetical protein